MRKLLSAFILAVLALSLFATPVLAIADPDSPPQVNAVYVYEDLLEDGDTGILVDYYLDYDFTLPITETPVPDETATEAFMAVFVDTDGATQLKTVAPYTFIHSGYGRGLIWLYFTAAETTSYGLNSANQTLYQVWLIGNPTLDWSGDPPKTIAGVDYWQTTGDPAVLLALRVLYYADQLELIWGTNMIEATALGNKLTTTGASYFENVITNLRIMAPAAFAAGEYSPVMEDLDYATEFGARMENGTGTVTSSPITLDEGTNVVTVTAVGTFVLTLSRGTEGTIEDNGGTVTGSPVDLVYGVNTVTVPSGGEGTLTVTVNLVTTQTGITDTIEGTGLDLTTVAARFGMSRLMFSGLIWMIISVIICAAVYRLGERESIASGGKVVLLVFDICIIGGAVLGLLSMLAAILLFIGFGAVTGYIIFFKGANV